jgi:hypothetical protein
MLILSRFMYDFPHRLCDLVVKSSWLQIQRSGFDSRALPDFLRSLERGPINLVSTTEELLERKSSGFGLEIREYIRPWESVTLTTWHPLPKKLAPTSPTSRGRSIGIVRSWTRATELILVSYMISLHVHSCSVIILTF